MAEALANDPKAGEFLPAFGFVLKDVHTYGQVETFRAWQMEESIHATFRRNLEQSVRQLVVNDGQPDGSLRQHLDSRALADAWLNAATAYRYYDIHRPSEDCMPLHIAAAIAALPGVVEWTVADDGTSAERVLPRWPARLPAHTNPLKVELKNKLLCECVCWAALPAKTPDNPSPVDEIVMISLVGQQKKLKAVWASLMDNRRNPIKLPSLTDRYGGFDVRYAEARRLDGSGRYQSFWNSEPLPESGLAHLVIEAKESISPRPGVPFAHITGRDGTPHLGRLFKQLDLALRLPIQEEWMADVWQGAQEAKLIAPIRSHGCAAFWVRADQDAGWARVIARAAGATGPDAGRIETIGTTEHKSEVVEEEEVEA